MCDRERERERERDQRERVNKREIMTRPRPTSFCVPLVKRVHTVTDTQAQAGVGGMVSDKSERKRERERERGSVTESWRVNERARWKVGRNEHEARCSSVDDSSLPWGARATHTRPRLDACVYAWCTRVRRELVTGMHSRRFSLSFSLSLVADLWSIHGHRIWRSRVHTHTHTHTHIRTRTVHAMTIAHTYERVYIRPGALSGSHRPHQHHSITRGTLWNHLPNHLVTSTQRNATGRHTVSFAGLPAVSNARQPNGG